MLHAKAQPPFNVVFTLSLCTAINATAAFGSQGVVGWVRFTESADGVDITANLAGLVQNASWSIRQFPVLTTLEPSQRGSSEYVGEVLDFPGGDTEGDLSARCILENQ